LGGKPQLSSQAASSALCFQIIHLTLYERQRALCKFHQPQIPLKVFKRYVLLGMFHLFLNNGW